VHRTNCRCALRVLRICARLTEAALAEAGPAGKAHRPPAGRSTARRAVETSLYCSLPGDSSRRYKGEKKILRLAALAGVIVTSSIAPTKTSHALPNPDCGPFDGSSSSPALPPAAPGTTHRRLSSPNRRDHRRLRPSWERSLTSATNNRTIDEAKL
jgi:hypothetical protein